MSAASSMPTPCAIEPAVNLLDTPWLPVRFSDGRTEELGLTAVFQQSAQIEGLAEPSPPSLVALYRVLLAITHRALTRRFTRWTDRDRAQWYREGLPVDAITDYLNHWRERFWLFHPEHPFMQVAALATAEETRDKLKPWTQVALASACGNSPVLFDHALDVDPAAIDAVVLLRQLLGFLQFTPGGLVKVFRSSDKGGPLANTAAVLPTGGTLARSLLLALHPAATPLDMDIPSWERAAPVLEQLLAEPLLASGPCDRYTRLSRSVQFLMNRSNGHATVRFVRFGAGLGLQEDDNAPDPMASYRAGSTGLVRLTFADGRAMWRDLGALLPDASGTRAKPAAVLNWAINLLHAQSSWDADVPVMVAGMCSDKAKLVRWRSEHFRLPCSSLLSAEVAATVRTALQRCDDIFYSLRSLAAEMLAQNMPDPTSKDTRARARAVLDASAFGPAYFSTAEQRLPVLLNLIGQAEWQAAHDEWSAALLQAAQAARQAARGLLGSSARAARAEALTHGRFMAALRPLRPEPDARITPIQEPAA